MERGHCLAIPTFPGTHNMAVCWPRPGQLIPSEALGFEGYGLQELSRPFAQAPNSQGLCATSLSLFWVSALTSPWYVSWDKEELCQGNYSFPKALPFLHH